MKKLIDTTSDEFPCRCRALTKKGVQCTRNARWIVQVTDRDSWLAALRTGWPCIVKGVITPKYLGRGLCLQHGSWWNDRDKKIEFKMIGESFKDPDLDKEYEDAVAIGDTKNGGVERKRKQNEKSISSGIQG